VEPNDGINPFLAPPVWEDPVRESSDATPSHGSAGAKAHQLSLGATGTVFSAAWQGGKAGEPSGIKKIKIKSKGDGTSLPIDWPATMERTAIAMSTSSDVARRTGFEAAGPPKDAAKEKAQKRANEIIAAGPSAVTMELEDK